MKFILALIILSFDLHAMNLCERLEGGISNYLELPESRISFKNRGGLMNGGVCWWHSRLLRSSAYLVEFRPELPKPSSIEVEAILKQLKQMKRVVEIPGFRDFYSFSQNYQKEIQKLLEKWQKEDGFINQQWVRGISGKHELEPKVLEEHMNQLYQIHKKTPGPIWLMVQIKGIESHAFLLLKMLKQVDGYILHVVDSNVPTQNKIIIYKHGQKNLHHPSDKYSFVPYSGFQKDFNNLLQGSAEFCGPTRSLDEANIPQGDVEI